MSAFRTSISIAAMSLGAAMAIPSASASELSTTASTGSVTFTVILPPMGPSVRAANDGAVGLWTVAGANEGLMLRFDQVGQGSTLTLYRRPGFLASVTVISSDDAHRVSKASLSDDGGLVQEVYDLETAADTQATISIAGV